MNALSRTMLDLSAALTKATAKEPRVFVCGRRTFNDVLTGKPGLITTVLVGGEYYEVEAGDLASLQAGMTPDDLGLYPLEENL